MKATTDPALFVRKVGLLSNSCLFIKKSKQTAVIIGGHTSREIVEGTLRKGLSEQGITLMHLFGMVVNPTTNNDSFVEHLIHSALIFS
ncbi:hypothetical protein ACFVHQ_16925 [Actinomycetes bacterium NPDC127524]